MPGPLIHQILTAGALVAWIDYPVALLAQTPEPTVKDEKKPAPKPWLDIYGFAMMDAGYNFK